MIREIIISESRTPIEIFNKAKELTISIKKGTDEKNAYSELKKLETEYRTVTLPIETKKIKELTKLLSNKLSSIAHIQQYNSVFILIDFKDEYRHKFKNSREISDFIHKTIGKRGVFRVGQLNVGNTGKATSTLLSFTDTYAFESGFPRWIELSKWELK